MKDKQDGSPRLRADTRQGHRRPFWHDDSLACMRYREAFWRLQALRAAHQIPRLWSRVTMNGCSHSWCASGLHITSRVRLACGYRKWADRCHMLALGGMPVLVRDSVEPYFTKRFNDTPIRSSICLGCCTGRIVVQMPVQGRWRQYSHSFSGGQIASDFAGTLIDRDFAATWDLRRSSPDAGEYND